MPKKDAAAEKAKDQLKRFKEKARELGVNEDPKAFDAEFIKVINQKSHPRRNTK